MELLVTSLQVILVFFLQIIFLIGKTFRKFASCVHASLSVLNIISFDDDLLIHHFNALFALYCLINQGVQGCKDSGKPGIPVNVLG